MKNKGSIKTDEGLIEYEITEESGVLGHEEPYRKIYVTIYPTNDEERVICAQANLDEYRGFDITNCKNNQLSYDDHTYWLDFLEYELRGFL